MLLPGTSPKVLSSPLRAFGVSLLDGRFDLSDMNACKKVEDTYEMLPRSYVLPLQPGSGLSPTRGHGVQEPSLLNPSQVTESELYMAKSCLRLLLLVIALQIDGKTGSRAQQDKW